MVVGAQVLILAVLPGRAGTVDLFDVAIPAGIVAVLGAAGVLLAQLIRSPIVAPLTAVLFAAAGFVAIASVATGTSWGRLLPMLPDDIPIALPPCWSTARPRRHLVYLVGLAAGPRGRSACSAPAPVPGSPCQRWRRRSRSPWRPARPSSPATTAVLAARVTTTDNPAPVQTCVSAGRGHLLRVRRLHGVDSRLGRRAARRGPPRSAGAVGTPPLAVRQWVWADGYPTSGGTFGPESIEARKRAQRGTDAAAGTPEAIAVGTEWGDNATAAAFAGSVAFRLVTGRAWPETPRCAAPAVRWSSG